MGWYNNYGYNFNNGWNNCGCGNKEQQNNHKNDWNNCQCNKKNHKKEWGKCCCNEEKKHDDWCCFCCCKNNQHNPCDFDCHKEWNDSECDNMWNCNDQFC